LDTLCYSGWGILKINDDNHFLEEDRGNRFEVLCIRGIRGIRGIGFIGEIVVIELKTENFKHQTNITILKLATINKLT
jgi:hypothetical protein